MTDAPKASAPDAPATPPAPPCTIAVFGAAGDLTKRLLMPSILNLHRAGLLHPETRVLGADHNARDDEGWRKELHDALDGFAANPAAESSGAADEGAWASLAPRLRYLTFDFTKDADYDALAEALGEDASAVFYLAVSPRFFEPIATGLARVGLMRERGGAFRRLVVEKPFGRDAASAAALNAALTSRMDEAQIYRIDHFLGKEAVYGLLALRFGGRAIEPLLSREHVASVQITAAETVGVEERGAFYEATGALRDMMPNHLFSLLTMVAMERPADFGAQAARDAKAALLRAMRPLAPEDAARGRYEAGAVGGKAVAAYRAEENVAADSRTETYVALTARVDNDRWRGVPFHLRTGKRMAAHVTTIAMLLRPVEGGPPVAGDEPQRLVFRIDPKRGTTTYLAAKRPGVDLSAGVAQAAFRYDEAFEEPPNVGYETLLYDVMRGDQALFQRDDMIAREWEIVQPVLDAWAAGGEPEPYAAGSAGPASADALLARDGDRWLPVETG